MAILVTILIQKHKDRVRIFESECSQYSVLFISSEYLKGFLNIRNLKDPIKFYSEEFLRLIQDSAQIFN